MGANENREEQATLLRAIFEHAREAIFVTDATGRYVDVNPAACSLTGYARDELLAMKIGDLALHSAPSEELWRRLVERGRAEGEHAIRRKDGAVRLIEYRTVADIIPGRHLGVVRDATDRVQAERELAANRERLALVLEGSGGAEWDLRLDPEDPERLPDDIYISPRIQEILGYEPARPIQSRRAFRAHVHPEDLPIIDAAMADHLAGVTSVYRAEYRVIRRDGAIRWLTTRGKILRDGSGRPLRWAGINWDVTDQHETAAALESHQDRLRRLTAELTRTEERERRELASLLHDEVGHGLALAHMRVAQVQALASGDDAAVELRALAEILDRTVAAVRSLTFELSSPLLHELGPEAALEWLAEETERRHGLRVHFRAEGSGVQLPEEVRNFLFRAARELLMNVVKHAGADQAELRLEVDTVRAALTVQDAGRGFDPQRTPGTAGFGLFYLVERARVLGGELDVQSGRDGTIVRVTVASNPPEAP